VPRLVEQLRDFWDRVEIVARGAERRRFDAARLLEAGKPWEARYEALTLLEELPRSPAALALWADSAEATWLDHEAHEALERLASEVPFRADVWYRLALVSGRLGKSDVLALERAAAAGEPSGAADAARLRLCERDLGAGDCARAERWLDRLSLAGRSSPEALARRAELWLCAGEPERARELRARLAPPGTLDAAGWLLLGKLCSAEEAAQAVAAFKRALLLEAPGAVASVQDLLWSDTVPGLAQALTPLIEDLGWADDPAWRASFAAAQGRRGEALEALADSATDDPARHLARYEHAALEACSAEHVLRAVALARRAGVAVEPALDLLARALETPDPRERVQCLDAVQPSAWAAVLRRSALEAWFFPAAGCAWPALLAELGRLCRKLGFFEGLRETEAIAVHLERPLRVAVLGEFNAGKSSFVNALLGEAVAQTGVLPTTTTVHRLAWAPERFARVETRAAASGSERVVPYSALAATLAALAPAADPEITLYAPLELLKRVELIDTPGFNAGDPAHAASARRALSEAHAAVWLFDASQPFKESERAVLMELKERKLPLFALLNKIDRLPDESEDRHAALAYVERGLAECEIVLEAPPMLFSARLALLGRQGDDAALASSRWQDVEALIESRLFSRSGELRERALLARARAVAADLRSIAADRAGERRAAHAERLAYGQTLRQAAARVQAERGELERALDDALASGLRELERVLLPVRLYSGDSAAERFVVQRTRALLATALRAGALAWLQAEQPMRSDLGEDLGARISVAAAALSPWLLAEGGDGFASVAADDGLRRRARAQLVSSCADELSALIEERTRSEPALPADPDELRADALVLALGGARAARDD